MRKISNNSDSVALEACIAGLLLGTNSSRKVAAITSGRKLLHQEWNEFWQNCNVGWDRMLLMGAYAKADKEVRHKERKNQRKNVSQNVSKFKDGMKESAKKSAERLIGKGMGIINSILDVSGSNHTDGYLPETFAGPPAKTEVISEAYYSGRPYAPLKTRIMYCS